MLFVDGGLALFVLGLWLFCLFDVITTDASLCRNLPKPVWVVIVLILPDVGSVLWLVAGHPWQSSQRPGGLPYKGNAGRSAASGPTTTRASNPDDDEAFLRRLQQRADSQRRAAPQPPEDPDKI